MRVLFINNRYPPYMTGGYEVSAALAAERLIRRGHSVRVLVSSYGLEQPRDDGRVHRRLHRVVDSADPVQLLGMQWRDSLGAHDLLRSFRPDIVSIWNMQGLFPTVLREVLSGPAPAVFHLHDFWLGGLVEWAADWRRFWAQPAHSFRQRFPKRALSWASKLPGLTDAWPSTLADVSLQHAVFCSDFQRRRHLEAGVCAPDARVILSGTDVERFAPARPGAPTRAGELRVLYVGRLVPEKGALEVVEAVSRLLAHGRNIELTVAGSVSPDGAGLERILGRLSDPVMARRTRVLPPVARDEMPDLYRAHDVLVLPTAHLEGLPRAPLEAMASGLAVVASASGGGAELLHDEDNALVVPARDSEALAGALQRLVDNPGLAMELGRRARAYVAAHHSIERTLDSIEGYYGEIVGGDSVRVSVRGDRSTPSVRRCVGKAPPPRTNPLRILVVNNRFPPMMTGGYEVSAALATAGLRQRGHSVEALVTRFGLKSGGSHTVDGVHRRLHRTVDSPHPTSLAAYQLLDRGLVRRVLRRFRPDIISVWNLQGVFPGVLLELQRAGVPLVLHLHDLWLDQYDAWIQDWRHFWARPSGSLWRTGTKRVVGALLQKLEQDLRPELRSVPRAVFCSEFARSYHARAGILADDSRVIYSGVDTSRYQAARTPRGGSLRLLFVGRFVPEKGPDVALSALRILAGEARAEVQLTLVGVVPPDRSYYDSLRTIAAEEPLKGRVRFQAATDNRDMEHLYAQHDVLVFPSVREGLPRSVMEAMASGMAVVSTPAGGTAEMLRDDENALVFPVGDSGALASALRRLLDEPGLVERLGRVARSDAATRFDVARTVAEIEAYYAEVAAGAKGSPRGMFAA